MAQKKKWKYRKANNENAGLLTEKLKISPVTALILGNRGIKTVEEAKKFLHPSLKNLTDPFLLKGMKTAVDRLLRALREKEKILIYGDYDVDGITSTALLYSLLKDLGGKVSFYIPSRFEEGYGLSRESLEKAVAQGIQLLVTVDCGEKATAEVVYAQEKGIDIIITDHHQPQGEVVALAHINPHREGPEYPFKDLAGVGVAFKLAQALLASQGRQEECLKFLDLVALGTVADIVPLLGENRILVKYGIEALNKENRPGVIALARVAGIEGREINAGHIGFVLAPRLNAAGRMGEATPGVELLLTSDGDRAANLAENLNEENKNRQKVEQDILEEARQVIEKEEMGEDAVLVVASEGWHEGVLGIVASRLVESFCRPVIALSIAEDGRAKGSGRSIPGFNLVKSLQEASPLLERFGGHELAAGLSFKKENIISLREKLKVIAAEDLKDVESIPSLYLDTRLTGKDITFLLAEELSMLAPFGVANPQPLLGGTFQVTGKRKVGKKENHLKLVVTEGKERFPALYFGNGSQEENPLCCRQIDLAFFPEINIWNGKKEISLMVKDLELSDSLKNESLTLVDQREIKEKKSYIQELVNYGTGNIIVYVNTRREEDLLSRLTGKDKIKFVHQGSNFPPEVKGRGGHLVLWSLPFIKEKVFNLISFLQSKEAPIEIHLLFGEEEHRQNLILLKASFPRQESLLEIFKVLSPGGGGNTFNIERTHAYVKKKLPYPVTQFLVKRGLMILKEAEILSGNKEMAITVEVGEKIETKVDNSPAYQEDSNRLEDFNSFQEYLLHTEKEKLFLDFLRSCTSKKVL